MSTTFFVKNEFYDVIFYLINKYSCRFMVNMPRNHLENDDGRGAVTPWGRSYGRPGFPKVMLPRGKIFFHKSGAKKRVSVEKS